MRKCMGPKAALCGGLLFALSCHPASSGKLFPFTGLDHCRARGEHRIPVPAWQALLWDESPVPPLPVAAGGGLLYIVLSDDMRLPQHPPFDVRAGGLIDTDLCGKTSYSPLVSFDVPNDKKNPSAGGVRLHFRAEAKFAHGTCSYAGFFFGEPSSRTKQGWTDVTLDPYDKVPPRKRYCLADVNAAPSPGPRKVLPPCDRRASDRIPIPV